MNIWVLSFLLAIVVGVLPFTLIAFWLAGIEKSKQGQSALSVWCRGYKLASLLMVVCDLVKPALVFVTVSLLFHHDVLALYAALLTAVIACYMHALKFKRTKSPLPLLGFSIILEPISGLFLCLAYIAMLLLLRRAHTACILLCLLAPCAAIFMADSHTPLTLSFVLPMILSFKLRKELLKYYPLKERKLPPLL
ncbi:MAG: glycerol-3-phosphate acyltransferase PlsY [Alphaproteobacteria bacterium]|jgi:glycerol-3-phosphate acyltransferase PlsY